MRNMFVFRYQRKFYRCIALPFGWGRSPLWFTRFMAPMVQYMRSMLSYRVLAYLDDFLVAPNRAGRVATKRSCARATKDIDNLLRTLGLVRHPTTGDWSGSTRIEHLGVLIDTVEMKFYVSPHKIEKVRSMSKQLLTEARTAGGGYPASARQSLSVCACP